MFDLSGKVALVTGGTGLLGAHLAKGLAEAGAEVILVSRTREKQERLAGEIRAAGGACDYVTCDLTDMADVARMCEAAWGKRGRVDTLVHNAVPGDADSGGIVSTTPEQWDLQSKVIYESALVMFRTLCPKMVAGEGGSLISVISSLAMIPQRGQMGFFAYGMAKGALVLLTKYAAQEFGPKVRANCISPGSIATGGPGTGTPTGDALVPRISLGRRGRSEECVGATIFLASPASSYISGQVFLIDGGRF
jgi:NAD(P)-dependent dehydrogenase (short-subunit alcohol dehydrogenase family)